MPEASPKACANQQCGARFTPVMARQKVCSTSCGLAYTQQLTHQKQGKAQRKKDLAWRRHPDNIPHRKFVQDADKAFGAYIRARDQGKPCPTCDRSEDEIQNAHGNKAGSPWNCGHWLPKAAYQTLRYNPNAAHRQCAKCNSGSHHHVRKAREVKPKFREFMVDYLGEPEVQRLEEVGEQSKKWTKEELIQIKEKFNLKTKILEDKHGT